MKLQTNVKAGGGCGCGCGGSLIDLDAVVLVGIFGLFGGGHKKH